MKKYLITTITTFILLLSSQLGSVHAAETKVVNFGVETTYPKYGQESVPVDSQITLDFTREIEEGSGEIYLYGKGQTLPFTKSISGDILTITPSQPLDKGTSYQVVVMNGAVVNAEKDNSPNGIGEKFVLSFSTPYIDLSQQQKPVTQQVTQPVTLPVTLQLVPETALQPAQTYTVKKEAPVTYKINATNGNYKLWTANPQLVSLQVQGDNLVIKGLSAGTTQVAIKNLLNNTKVVLNVVVQ
ncbi:hypothetical protein A616_17440 [Brevibacillus brevis X23]|nr:hypothetical protein A616_17440 [Brevibacillus brevis X23]